MKIVALNGSPVSRSYLQDLSCRSEDKATKYFKGKYATAISTSAHFYDHTARRSARMRGLVTHSATSKHPAGMCNCCGEFCGVLRTLRKHPRPATEVFSNHSATVNQDECTGCETCLERCQMDAIVMTDEETAEINPDRCIGCGLCVTTCPTEAIELLPKSETDWRDPPLNASEQIMSMALKRGII